VLRIVVTAGEESWPKGAEESSKLLLFDEIFGGKIAELVKGPVVSSTEIVVAWRKSEQ
jgi:hypothetical protein